MMSRFQFTSRNNAHNMYNAPRTVKFPNRGFTLVEIMVALVIGMIGILVIMQVARTGEAQKRVTTGAGNAQNGGALAIYAIQRDVKQAGYGFSAHNVMGCRLDIPAAPPLDALTLDVLAPVTINSAAVPAGDHGSDTLLVAYGSSSGPPEGDTITDALPLGNGQWLGVMSATHYTNGDKVLAAPATAEDCGGSASGLILGSVTNIEGTTVQAEPGVRAQSSYSLFNLGTAPKIIAYAVRGGNLSACDYTQSQCSKPNDPDSGWQVVASGIVSLRAQYGHNSDGNDGVDTWDQTSPTRGSGESQANFNCEWAQISAIRLALVARNSEASRDVYQDGELIGSGGVTGSVPLWAGSDDAPIDLSRSVAGDPAVVQGQWKNYRYHIFETIMPLRNIPWLGLCS